jgi:hypothetical protein
MYVTCCGLVSSRFSTTFCKLIITTPSPSTTTFSMSTKECPFLAYKVSAVPVPCSSPLLYCSISLHLIRRRFFLFPFVLRSSALSASSHPWRHLTPSSPHSLSSGFYSVPSPFIGTWKVRPRAPFSMYHTLTVLAVATLSFALFQRATSALACTWPGLAWPV